MEQQQIRDTVSGMNKMLAEKFTILDNKLTSGEMIITENTVFNINGTEFKLSITEG